MSRTGWAVLLLAGAAAGVAVYMLTRGLPDEVKTEAQAAKARVEKAEQDLKQAGAGIDDLVKEDEAFLGDRPEVAEARRRLGENAATLKVARDLLDGELKKVIDADRHKDRVEALNLVSKVNAAADDGIRNLGEPAAAVRRLLGYKKNHETLADGARKASQSAQLLLADAMLISGLDTAGATYTDAKPKLDAKLQKLKQEARSVPPDMAQLETLLLKKPIDYVATGTQAESIVAAGQRLQAKKAALLNSIVALGRSLDKILIDMKEERPRYYHKYKIVENGKARETGWIEVPTAKYRQHKKHLGMTIYSKPEGVLEEDATETPAPPGYNYIGQRRYGYWSGHGPSRYWVWYGQYALMRDVFWGPGYYRPMSYHSYHVYHTQYRTTGRAYYGAKNQYGTSGTRTRSRYSKSRFMTKRAAAARSSSSSRSGGGYRTSRSRSSSFGGGGK